MLDHFIGVIVATVVDQTRQPPTISQTVAVAVAGSAMQHGIALQLQVLPHTAGSLACEMITFEALDEVRLGLKACFFPLELDVSFLANNDSK